MIVENSDNCDCYDIKRVSQNFWLRVYGIKVVFQLSNRKETIIFNCICDDVIFDKELELKDYLIYNEEEIQQNKDYENKLIENYNNDTIDNVIKEFINVDPFYKRKILINFLKTNNEKLINIALLLYDLLNIRRKSFEYNSEKKMISLTIPNYLKSKLLQKSKCDINKVFDLKTNLEVDIPMDTKIKMLKVSEYVKSKLFLKYKEFKSKGDDNGKIRQYLDGILSVPFGVYIKEEVFKISDDIKKKTNMSVIEFVYNYNDLLKTHEKLYENTINITIPNILKKKKKNELSIINSKYKYVNKKSIINLICEEIKTSNKEKVNDILYCCNISNKVIDEYFNIKELDNSVLEIKNYIENCRVIMNKSIYSQNNVKREIQRVITSWITGNNEGYCLGFEGPPGVGKTTIAKYGISECLKDSKDNCRPFNFLSLGGSNNSNLLDGHNYTYVGSTWGKLVDFLIKSKCMNPIIYIDELDKVSKTEHGNEIIGILTHLTDSSQNQHIADKYFSGIPFDFSKVLFIFSYNDASLIDPILLDRIHRVKFNYLKENEKLIIAKEYIIPELYKNIGLNENILKFTDDNLLYIIRNFTNEPGVRKLKEILFIIISEINIRLVNKDFDSIPIKITNDNIKEDYLKEKNSIIEFKINQNENKLYGLWANSLGMGGVLPINIKEFLSKNIFELKLTGLPGKVMKESMYVSQTIAWNYLNDDEKKIWSEKNSGLHIHCPDGSTNKDGPSAGSVITLAIMLFLKNILPNNSYGITGEINLDGEITAIGGLELKINGGIRAGLKHFIFPKQNSLDFEKIEDKSKFGDITFHQVENIDELLKIIL